MGMKKEIFRRALRIVFDKTRRDPHFVKKVVGIALVFGLVIAVGFGFLLYFAVGFGKDLVANKPDLDLLAMERLIAEKSMVLTEEQQRLLAPVVEGLAVSDLAPEQAKALKEQLLGVVTPSQLAKMEAWKADAASKAAGLFALPPAVAAIIERYTGISPETVAAKTEAFRAWWRMTRPGNSAEQLQKTMKTP